MLLSRCLERWIEKINLPKYLQLAKLNYWKRMDCNFVQLRWFLFYNAMMKFRWRRALSAQLDSWDCTLADDDGPTNSRTENHEIATREEPLVVLLFLPTPAGGPRPDVLLYSFFTCALTSSPLRLARAPKTGLGPRVFFFFILAGGSLGKADAHQEEKGLPTHALEAKSGNSFRARKPAGYFLFLMVLWRDSSSPLTELCMLNWILETRGS